MLCGDLEMTRTYRFEGTLHPEEGMIVYSIADFEVPNKEVSVKEIDMIDKVSHE